MKPLTSMLSMILGINKSEAQGIVNEVIPKITPAFRFLARLICLIMFVYCLYAYTVAAILIAALAYFIIQLEERVAVLEKEIEIERRLNREAYSTERYSARPGYGEQNKGHIQRGVVPERGTQEHVHQRGL